MLTYRTGAAGAPSVAKLMADHLAVETDVPELQEKLAQYYGNGLKPDAAHQTAAIPRIDMHPALAELLAIDPTKPLSTEQVTHLLTGLRADGAEIQGKQVQKNTKDRTRIAYIDLCLSAPKSFSVALAFAPTEAERAILDRAHRDAVDATIAHIAEHIGVARKGKAGSKGFEPGHVAWVQFDHFTARPTLKLPVSENGIQTTAIQTVRVAGDPQRHTHVILPNVVLSDSGRVTSFFQQRIKSRIHEWGSVYQAFLATNLRRSGVEVELDSDERKTMNERMARLTSVPRWVSDLFSKRTDDGEEAARRYAAREGVDWDSLSQKAKSDFLKGGTRRARQFKGDDLADYAEWQRQAKDAGYQHRSILRPGEGREPAPLKERLQAAYEASLPVLAPELQRRSTFEGQLARVAAAKGLISTGIGQPAEIDLITKAYRTEGVQQDGASTALMWGRVGEGHFQSFTTQLHVEQENEAISLLQAAAADRASALTPAQIEVAVQRVTAESGLDFTSEHGRLQREMIEKLGTAGRAVVGTGVAGAGKTALLHPLIDAWHEAGRTTYGVTLAWRQAQALDEAGVGRRRRKRREADTRTIESAGVSKSHAFALSAFINQAESGKIPLDGKAVVIIDEIAQVGTRQLLDLARLQAKHGFQIVGLGDDRQCQSIQAGNTIRLFQKALGTEQVPELLNTIRQQAERDRETSLLFRDGQASEALARKDEDNTLRIVPGGYRQAVAAAVDLWEHQRRVNAGRPDYSIAISVPTNSDAREVGAEIRRRRQAAGEIGSDQATLAAVDQTGTEYGLPVAVGDRLRLFDRVGRLGYNGSVVDVVAIDGVGATLRNKSGHQLAVNWDRLRDKETGRIRLTYGDALTIDARQGDTLTEHITVMPSGSKAVNGFKAYTTESRHRVRSWIVTSEGEELHEIFGRRPLGDPRNHERDPDKVRDAVIANMARNLSRHPEKVLGTDFLETANKVRTGAIRAMQAAWHHDEVKLPTKPIRPPAAALKEAVSELGKQQQAVRAAVKAARSKAPHRPERPRMSDTEAQATFADALQLAGFRLKGPPIMDGKIHRAPVDGDRGKKTSGSYVGHLDGWPAGYIHNFKTGEEIRWRADGPARAMNDADRARLRQEQERARATREAERRGREESVAAVAVMAWAEAKPARPSHPYLKTKGVDAHGLREGQPGQKVPMTEREISIAGRLLVPMRDAGGKLWNLQMIDARGGKVFMPGRKQGLFAALGKLGGDEPLMVAEGFATAATLRETTALTSVVAFDSGNLMPVTMALRDRFPERTMIIGADNDHHLPRRDPPLPNVGLEKAKEAADATGASMLVPAFRPNDSGTDWNDWAAQHGKQQAGELVRGILRDRGVPVPEPKPVERKQAGPVTQERRDAARLAARTRRQRNPRRRPEEGMDEGESLKP